MLSQMSLNLSFFKLFYFLLLCSLYAKPFLPDSWFVAVLLLIWCWFLLVSFILWLLYSSALIFFNIFVLFVEILSEFIHFSLKFGKHLYYHYFELFIRLIAYLHFNWFYFWFCLVPSFGTYYILSSFFFDVLCLFLWIRVKSYLSQCWRSGLVKNISWVDCVCLVGFAGCLELYCLLPRVFWVLYVGTTLVGWLELKRAADRGFQCALLRSHPVEIVGF